MIAYMYSKIGNGNSQMETGNTKFEDGNPKHARPESTAVASVVSHLRFDNGRAPLTPTTSRAWGPLLDSADENASSSHPLPPGGEGNKIDSPLAGLGERGQRARGSRQPAGVIHRAGRHTRFSQPEFRVSRFEFRAVLMIFLLVLISYLFAQPTLGMGFKKKGPPAKDHLAEYIERVKGVKATAPVTGSLWTLQSPYSDMGSDYKARNINDLIVIQVVESTTAAEDGAVKTARTFSASSGISGLMGTPGPTSGLQNIFSPNSTRTLNGQGQTSSNSNLSTSLSGRVVDVLPNGFLVIEAVRQIYMNNQHQTVIIHGVVRPGDIGSNNAVPSTSVSNLELELQGRGVISDGVAPPNRIVRMILKLVGF